MVEVVNVVAGGDLRKELDLDRLEEDLFTHMLDRKHNGLYIKRQDNSPLIILYRSGKYVITGASSITKSRTEKNGLINMLNDLGIRIIEPTFSIYNLVCRGDLGQTLDLEKLHLIIGFEKTEYEPEQSPFMIYRSDKHDCVITISSSGKSVINGVKSLSAAEESFRYLKSLLDEKGDSSEK